MFSNITFFLQTPTDYTVILRIQSIAFSSNSSVFVIFKSDILSLQGMSSLSLSSLLHFASFVSSKSLLAFCFLVESEQDKNSQVAIILNQLQNGRNWQESLNVAKNYLQTEPSVLRGDGRRLLYQTLLLLYKCCGCIIASLE